MRLVGIGSKLEFFELLVFLSISSFLQELVPSAKQKRGAKSKAELIASGTGHNGNCDALLLYEYCGSLGIAKTSRTQTIYTFKENQMHPNAFFLKIDV